MIEAQSASLVYNDHNRQIFACKEIDLTIQAGEFLGILGPSGSGKSSLLYLLSGLKQPTSGSVLFDGQPLSNLSDDHRSHLRKQDFGFVFQYPFLIGYLTALENVLIGMGEDSNPDQARALLNTLGLSDKIERYPHELSGGEKQRVCVARSLTGSRRAIFADEPTAALDHTNGKVVVEMLNRHRGDGSLVIVTHDESMLETADRVIQMSDGQILLT